MHSEGCVRGVDVLEAQAARVSSSASPGTPLPMPITIPPNAQLILSVNWD
jgi:hypothetical protein